VPTEQEPASESAGSKQTERKLSELLDQLKSPLKQVQEWVNGGQLQSVVGELQEKAGRAQEQVERRLQALDEVRQGLQVHVKKQLEELKREGRTGAEAAGPPASDPPQPTEARGGQTKAPRAAQPKKRGGKKRTPPK
jgi:hypothetical protein